MCIVITCGPGCEPIDEVRFLSNFSTGELGALLAGSFCNQGWEVICLRSRLATYPMSGDGVEIIPFSTNEELAAALQQIAREKKVAALFHAAALCDYRVTKIVTAEGVLSSHGKIPTSQGNLTMTLEPTMKVIRYLRLWFPEALLVGWKYEVDGTHEAACHKALEQIGKYSLDASIANGPALKNNFEFIPAKGSSCFQRSEQAFLSKEELVAFLSMSIATSLL